MGQTGPYPESWAWLRKNNYALESLDAYIVWGCCELEPRFRLRRKSRVSSQRKGKKQMARQITTKIDGSPVRPLIKHGAVGGPSLQHLEQANLAMARARKKSVVAVGGPTLERLEKATSAVARVSGKRDTHE